MDLCQTLWSVDSIMKALQKRQFTLVALCALLGVLLAWKPAQVPPVWYDEGSKISLARNWVELRHYGYLLMGEPVPVSIMFTGMPAVAPIALSFRFFGIGLWQARLPGIFFTLGGLAVLYYLAGRLYDRSVAVGTLTVALLLSPQRDLHPVLLGRQALGEMPAVFFLLVGLALFSWAWKRPRSALPLAILFWALSLRTKPQMLPFLAAGLSFPLAIAFWKRCWRTARILMLGLLGTLVTFGLLTRGQELLLRSQLFTASSGHDLYSWLHSAPEYWFTHVVVLDLLPRLMALYVVVGFGMPVLLGLCYTAWKSVRNLHHMDLDNDREVCRLVLWTFAASCMGWFLLLSAGWPRHLFTAAFVGNVFVALLLQDVAGGFNLPRLARRGVEVLKHPRFTVPGMGMLLAVIFIPAAFLTNVATLYDSYVVSSDDSVLQAIRFLNTQTSSDAVIETYERELFFLLERPYHYPPRRVENQLIRRNHLRRNTVIDYDPLSADPDYLVVGDFSRTWHVYDSVLETGAFRPVFTSTRYEIYERVR